MSTMVTIPSTGNFWGAPEIKSDAETEVSFFCASQGEAVRVMPTRIKQQARIVIFLTTDFIL